MNVYDFKKLEKCYVCGNIDKNIDKFIQILTSNLSNYEKVEHPKEAERQERLRNRENQARSQMGLGGHLLRRGRTFEDDLRASMKKAMSSHFGGSYNDSVIIVSGNCGIGSKSMNYYDEVFGGLNKVLMKNNCFLLFVRGNNDDPSIFNEQKINLSNVKAIPDYSVVVLKPFNCLCIGGSISLDREWKLSQEEQFGKKLYWDNESPFLDEKALDEILNKYQIGCVVTSTSPSFAFPGTNAFNKSKWIANNSSMKNIFSSERKILDKVYDKFIENDVKPYVWVYGRFKQHSHTKVNDIVFDSLSSFQIEDIRNLITSYFGIDISKKLGGNVFTFDTFIADDAKQPSAMYEMHFNDEENVEGEVGDDAFEDEDEELDEVLGNAVQGRENVNHEAVQNTVEAEPQNARLYNPYAITQEDIQRAADQLNETIARVGQNNRGGIFEPYYDIQCEANPLGEITHNGR